MAGTATVTVSDRISLGGTDYMYLGTIKPDASYATNGDTLTNPTTGIKLPEKIKDMQIATSEGIGAEYVPSSGKVQLWLGAESGAGLKGPKEAGNGVDYSALSFRFRAIGS